MGGRRGQRLGGRGGHEGEEVRDEQDLRRRQVRAEGGKEDRGWETARLMELVAVRERERDEQALRRR